MFPSGTQPSTDIWSNLEFPRSLNLAPIFTETKTCAIPKRSNLVENSEFPKPSKLNQQIIDSISRVITNKLNNIALENK